MPIVNAVIKVFSEQEQGESDNESDCDAQQGREAIDNWRRNRGDSWRLQYGDLRRFPTQLRKVSLIALAQYDDSSRGKLFQHGAIGMADIDHADAAGVVRGDTQGAQIKVGIAELRAHFVAEAAAANPIREGVDRQFRCQPDILIIAVSLWKVNSWAALYRI